MKNCTVRLKTLRTHHLFVRLSNTLHQFGIHLKKQQISQVEQLQRKAARYVFNDYRDRLPGAVTNMIDTLQWDSLACRRTKASLILLYKINEAFEEVPTAMISQSDRRTRGAHKFRHFSQIKIFISLLSSLVE